MVCFFYPEDGPMSACQILVRLPHPVPEETIAHCILDMLSVFRMDTAPWTFMHHVSCPKIRARRGQR